jgi:hypothetical protein
LIQRPIDFVFHDVPSAQARGYEFTFARHTTLAKTFFIIDIQGGGHIMNDTSMENKMKQAIESLYTTCLGEDGVAPQQRVPAREAIDALRMLCAYQTFDIEATRRENVGLRALIKGKRKPRRKD